MVEFVIGFLIGAALGAGIALIVALARGRAAQRQMREAFSSLAAEALDANARRLTGLAGVELEAKRQLIAQSVTSVGEALERVRGVLQQVEAERKKEFGDLGRAVSTLAGTAGELHRMLASTQRRGAWGERMAEDVLRLAGLQEDVNYSKQDPRQVEQGRPDFTFFLPNDLKCNMDVKFPLEAYKAYADAATDEVRAAAQRQLVQAVRGHVRDVAGRGYIDPAQPTVNYVIVFIPSEQIFSLVLAAEKDIIDEALARKVVLASPLTLYAMLAVVRQAAESANVMRTADEVISLLGAFSRQWQKYNEELDRLGSQLGTVQKTYDALRTTRTNMLQRPLDRIEDLRQARNLPEG